MDQLNRGISLHTSRATFENSGASDPRTVDDDIAFHKHHLSKLKFLYLEQETRDRFLGNLLANKLLDNDAVVDITAQNAAVKSTLQSLNDQIDATIASIDTLAQDVVAINERHEVKHKEVRAITADIAAMDARLLAVITLLSDNDDHLILYNLQKSVSDDIDFDRIIDISSAQLEADIATYNNLRHQLEQRYAQADAKVQTLNMLNAQLAQLVKESESPEPTPDSRQVHAHLVKQLIALLEKFLDPKTSVEYSATSNSYIVTINGTKVEVDTNLNVVEPTNAITSGNVGARVARLTALFLLMV